MTTEEKTDTEIDKRPNRRTRSFDKPLRFYDEEPLGVFVLYRKIMEFMEDNSIEEKDCTIFTEGGNIFIQGSRLETDEEYDKRILEEEEHRKRAFEERQRIMYDRVIGTSGAILTDYVNYIPKN